MTKTRQQHLDFCKARALEYVDAGDQQQAFQSMASDLGKHDETSNHPGIGIGLMLIMIGDLNTAGSMRNFINGFN